jgi:hypothetical protein
MSPVGVYFLSACAGTLWVAFDARRFDWHRNTFCDRVWKWVVGCLFLFGIAFPAYLWQRRKVPLRGSGAHATATPTFSSDLVEGSGSSLAVIQRAAEELSASSSRGWQPEYAGTGYSPPADKPPLLVSQAPADLARNTTQGSLVPALLAGAVAALVGGLIWAGAVIATRYDIGFLAWFVGAATGGTVFRIFGAPVRGAARVATGLIAAGAIVVGKYVIFVHDVRKAFGRLLAEQGLSVGYLDTRLMSIFVHHFGSIVRPIYGLWILIAFVAALMTAQPRKARTTRRR